MKLPSAHGFKTSVLTGLLSKGYAALRKPAQPGRGAPRRKVVLEAIEPRLLLSADLLPGVGSGTDGDDSFLDASAPTAPLYQFEGLAPKSSNPAMPELNGLAAAALTPTQVFFLETGGASNVDYRGPVTVEDIEVPIFAAPDALAGQEAEVLSATLQVLNSNFLSTNLLFMTERPQDGAFSTIYLGGAGEPFLHWGSYYGLSQGIDFGNQIADDVAFVFSDNIFSAGMTVIDFAGQLAATVAHEAGHLMGTTHAHADGDGPLAAVAFDPKVHVAIGVEAADDAADGKVTINDKEYAVHPLLVTALTNQRAFYNGGAVAGDGFPDVLMGQFAIHPIDHGTWLTRVLDMAWAAQDDGSFSADEKSQILAWSYGFLTHSAGDHFAHTLVNSFAEGVAPGFGLAAESIPTDQRDLGNMLRHFMTEAYIADALPGFDGNKTDRTEIVLDSGDFTDDTTPGIAFDAPARFIYEVFLRAFPNDPTPIVEMDWDRGTLVADAASDSFTRSEGSFKDDGFKVGHKITVAGFATDDDGSPIVTANDGSFFVTAISANGKVMTVDGALDDQTASGDEKIVVFIAKTLPGISITANATDNTFARSDGGSFVADGFVEGMRFDALGLTANFRSYIVKIVTPTQITVVGALSTGPGTYGATFSELADETRPAQLVGIGQRGPGLDNIFKLRDAVLAKAATLGARGDPAELETIAGQLIEHLVDGKSISSPEIEALKAPLFKAYLYNWADEIDEGVRHWGELGLAFTKAVFDADSRRDLQQKVGEDTGFADSADKDSIRSKAEDGVGILDVLIHELDDPDGNGLTFDSFINRHLLPMAGLPAELGMLRSGMAAFGEVVGDILQPLKDVFNPLQAAVSDVKNYVKDFLKDQFKERFGFDFEVFDYLKSLNNKMDLASITLPGGAVLPIFKPGDHDRLDTLLGLPDVHHEGDPPIGVDKVPGFNFTFYDGAQDRLTDDATMDTTTFAAFANAVTLTKMLYLMESPAVDAVAGAGLAAGQLSMLYGDILTSLNGAATPYDFGRLNLHGAHGGNVLTSTLPGVLGADGRPWMVSIDADQVWRQDNLTVANTLYRVSEFNDIPSAVVYEATALEAGVYKVYASWQGNVTQDLDNLGSSDLPDQKLSPTQFAQYTVAVVDIASGTELSALTFQMDQRNFANDLDDGGLGFEQIKSATLTDPTFTLAAGQKLRISLSDVTGENKHVVAGPILLVRTSHDERFRIQNNRDPQTLLPVATPDFTYLETTPGAWSDLAYEGGSGNNPLWESAVLRPVFRELFDDWINPDEDFPALGDPTSPDPNTVVIAKSELGSHATTFGPVVADNDIDIPITATVKGLILDGLQGAVDLAEKLETSSPLDLDLPGLGKSLGELIQLSSAIRDGVQQPVVDFFTNDLTPTFRELFALVSPSLGGLGSGSALEFDLDLRALLEISDLKLSLGAQAEAVGLELNGSIDLMASFGFVDPDALDQPLFSFGIDLSGGLSFTDRVYVRAETFLLHAEAHADMLDFGASFAFLSVGVKDGSVDLTLDVQIDFVDPSGDGRITLAEVFGSSSMFFDNIVITATGTLDVELPLEVGGLPGLTSGSLGKLEFHASNIFEKSTYVFDTSEVNANVFNFHNIDAAAIVTLVAQLSDQLENLRQGGAFDGIDIPFIDGAVSTVLDFAEVVSDGLLYDDGADGLKDGTDRLVTDLNAALASAGLASAIVAQADGTHIDFQIIDPTVDEFKVEAGIGDAGGFTILAFAPGAAVFADAHRATPASANGVVASNAKLKFTLKRGSQLTETTVTLDAANTADNTGIGDDVVKLVRADNSATFKTAQDFVFRMSTILGYPDLVAYDPDTKALTIKVGDLLPTFTLEKAFDIDFDVDLGPLLDVQSDTQVRVRAEAGIDPDFLIGIYLGDVVPGAQSSLTGTTTLQSLNDGDGIDIKDEPAITAPQAVTSALKALTGDAHFEIAFGNEATGAATSGTATSLVHAGQNFVGKVSIGDTVFNLDDGSSAKVTAVATDTLTLTALTGGSDNTWTASDKYRTAHRVTVAALPAASDIATLLTQVNAAINSLQALTGKLVATADGNRISFVAVNPATVQAFTLTADKNDPAVKDLGLQASLAAGGALVGNALSAFKLVGGDATFKLTIGAVEHAVVVTKASTSTNTTIDQLVVDVNAALVAAGVLPGKMVADKSGNALMLRITDPALSSVAFSAVLDGPAVLELGLTDDATITKPTIKAAKDVAIVIGRLNADTVLTIATTGGPSGQVTLYADDTLTNTTVLSLVNDLNQALALPSIKTGVLTSFPVLPIDFTVKVGDGAATAVSVLSADLAGNLTLSDLVADINNALKEVGLDDVVIAKPAGLNSTVGPLGQARIEFEAKGTDTSSLSIRAAAGNGLNLATGTTVATGFAGKLIAESVGNKLVISAVEGSGITGFSVTSDANGGPLGLPAGSYTASNVDFVIRLSDGTTQGVTLDPTTVTDIETLIAAIEAQVADVEVTINEAGTGLTLTDTTFQPVVLDANGKLVSNPNSATFMVSAVNGSAVAAQLRIVGLDSIADASLDGQIDGGQLTGTKLTDRFFLRNLALNASLTLDTPYGVNASANFGFVGITLTGSADLDARLSIGLKDPGTSLANDEVSLTEFINGLSAPLTLLDPPSLTGLGQLELGVALDGNLPFITLGSAKVGADVNLGDVLGRWDAVDLTGVTPLRVDDTSFTLAGDFGDDFLRGARVTIPSAGFGAFVDSVSVAAGVTTVTLLDNYVEPVVLPTDLSGLAIDTPTVPLLDFHASGLDDLLSFGNVDFNFASIIDALLLVRDLLSEIDAVEGLLNQPIPLVDVSVNDLLEFADTFSDALTAAQNNPAGSLQLLDKTISEAFGVDPAGDLLVFTLDELGNDDRGDDLIKLSLNLGAAFNRSLNVRIPDLGLPTGVVDFGGAATLGASGSATFSLDIGIGLNDPSQFYLYDSSGLHATLALAGTDMSFKAGLGPLSLSVIDGQASISGTVDVGFDAGHFTDGRVLLSFDNLGDVLTDLDVVFAAPISASLPIYFPTETHLVGAITLTGDLRDIGGGLVVKTDSTPADPGQIVLDVSNVIDGLASGLTDLSLLDQILFIVDGVDAVLGGVQDVMDGEVLGFSMPLIGDKLAGAADVVGDFRASFVNDFRNEVEKLADPGGNGIQEILQSLLGPTGLLIGEVQTFNNLATATSVADAEIWWKMKIGQTLASIGGDIGLDLGIPGLGLETDGEIQLDINWELDLGFGLSGADGFFFFIDDPDELLLNVSVTLPGGSLKGTLGFLEFTAVDKDVDGDGKSTHLSANFAIDIGNSGDVAGQPPDTRLGLSELGRMSFDVLFDAEASAELAMTLGVAGDNGGFPEITADFLLDWRVDGDPNTAGAQPINLFSPPAGFSFGSAIKDGLQKVEFSNVNLDVGAYISDVVGPLVQKIKDVTEPVQPLIDIVTTPLPVLSDLGLSITLLDIAKQTGAVNTGFITAIESVLEVVKLIDSLDIPTDGSLLVPFGSFTVFDRARTTGLGDEFDLSSANFDVAAFAAALKPDGALGTLISNLPGGLDEILGGVAGAAGDIMTGLADTSGGGKGGFAFPVLSDPSQVFGMLMGKPAVLVTYDMAPLDFKAEFSAFFSIFGPLGVSINLEAALHIDFAFGYDSQGFVDFSDSGYKNPLLLANGLYVSDDPTNPLYDGTGDDPPELTFDGGLWAAAELNLGIARGGVGGGIFIGVDFNLFDNDDDGRIRLDELAGNFLNQLNAPGAEKLLAPLAVFDVSGQVTAELFAFLKIDFGLFELNKKFNITPPLVLADFNVDFFRPPILATETGNGDLIINIGDFAAQRLLGNVSDFGEHIYVEDAGPGKVNVWSDNLGSDAAVKQTYSVSGRIIAVGGEGDDIIDLSGVHATNIKFELDGGVGKDMIKGGDGGGIIRGGVGNDTLYGGAGNDLIFGNEGGDILRGGGGADIVLGDNGDVTEGLIDMAVASRQGFVRGLVTLTDGADFLYGEGGDDILIGSGGVDAIDGGLDNDLIIGDGALLSFNSPPVVSDSDKDTGGFGDLLVGGEGNDKIYGGKGNDSIDGDNADGSGTGNDIVFGESGMDTIRGGNGNDILFGDSGTFFGGDLAKPTVTGGGEADIIYGGFGADMVLGGGGNDELYGDDGLGGGVAVADDDRMWGGTGADEIHGDGGDDTIFGESDPDELFGDAGRDYLEGGQGNDIVWGGIGGDLLVAGYGSDTLDGQAGSDTYRITARGGSTTELSTAYDSGTDGADTDQLVLVGTPEADTVLLRAMADYYFPTLVKLIGDTTGAGLTDKILASGEPDKLRTILQALEDSYGPHDIPTGLIGELIDLFVADVGPQLMAALTASYVAPQAGSTIPTLDDLKASVNAILATDSRNKLEEMHKAITVAYGTNVLPPTMLDALSNAWNDLSTDVADVSPKLIAALALSHVAPTSGSTVPTLATLTTKVNEILITDSHDKLNELTAAITTAYGSNPLPDGMLTKLTAAWNALLPVKLEAAIESKYQTEQSVLGSDTDTGFVALINQGGVKVERFNYRNLEGLVVNTLAGNDYVVLDDVIAATTINLGLGEDKAQVGQVFRSERVRDPGAELITGITAADVFTTLEITRGWLSNGVSQATTINGGDDSDQFTVFHNIAVLNLNGGDGDDVFTVRAFALKGSSDSERARTDMKGDGGADTILYAMNAPVGIDGGDGFDTVRVVGTEFADDFVVTDAGIFGGGLNVSYVNIEKLVVDGAEGDDRFFVQSTGVEVVTELDGGLGSDSFFVGGNPSNAPVAVISNDFKGHSGVILHSVESGDAAWNDLPVEGLSANVGDNEEDFVIVREIEGFSRVVEGAALTSGEGWGYDLYGIRLTRAPGAGQEVSIAVVPAGMAPEDEAKGFKDLEFLDAGLNSYGFNALTGVAIAPTLKFNSGNWDTLQWVRFKAADDVASEGRRFVFINHTLQKSTDPEYQAAKMLSVKVEMLDNDRDDVLIVPSGRGNTVLEDGAVVSGLSDTFDVVLAKKPTADVTVTMSVLGGQVVLSGPSVTGGNTLTFTSANWDKNQTVTITAPNDIAVEGLHTEYISYTVSSLDIERTLHSGGGNDELAVPAFVPVDGDFDLFGVQPIPAAKPTTYVLLPHKPIADTVVVTVAGEQLANDRFEVSGNTLTFLSETGAPEFHTGAVMAKYSYLDQGYDGAFVKDSVVDIYDEDTPTVIIEMVGDGSLDVIEGSTATDQYSIRLSRAPDADVTVTADAVKTRSTYGRTALFQEQVTVNGESITTLTFNANNWSTPQLVTVGAFNDTVLDGNDTQVFAPDLQTVNKIRGPLIVEGASGAGSLSLPKPLMLPNERNILKADGNVVTFFVGDGDGALEHMDVLTADLEAVVARLQLDDSTITSIQDLVGLTLELSTGPGTGVVLDPTRPEDKFDRFWQITRLDVRPDDSTRTLLYLQNPSIVNPRGLNVTQPDENTEYAITSLSLNFFAVEREQIDTLYVYDNDSVANDQGALTSSDGVVRGFTAATAGAADKLLVEAASLQAVASLVGETDLGTLEGRRIEISVGPGQGRSWLIDSIGAGADSETRWLTLSDPRGAATAPTVRSEFRIDGGDTHGRITGFGMGPNILFNGRPQPGGTSYGDIEVVQVSLGRGDDQVRVDYATNAEDHTTERSGDYYTLTLLDTGAGNDTVTVALDAVQDGAFALNLNAGNDTANAQVSTAPLVIFGWDGDDTISGGSADDILFGDRGRVDYVRTVMLAVGDGSIEVDQIVTRLGHSVEANPVNPPVTGGSEATLTDSSANFSTEYGGLVGLSVQAISPTGKVQFRTIVANTATTLTVDRRWDATPTTAYFYRVSAMPEDQTDGLFRGPRVAWTIDDAVGGNDTIHGGDGNDIVVGGAGGDTAYGDADDDIVVGDGARLDLSPASGLDGATVRTLLAGTAAGVGGVDHLFGGAGADILMGGAFGDTIVSGEDSDIVFGDVGRVAYTMADADPSDIDRIESIATGTGGNDTITTGTGDDIVIGGFGDDVIDAGSGRNLVFGDNGLIRAALSDLARFGAQPITLGRVETVDPTLGGSDTIITGDGDDIVLGGNAGDILTVGAGHNVVLGDDGTITFTGLEFGAWNTGDDADASDIDEIVSTSTTAGGGTDSIVSLGGVDIVIGGRYGDIINAGDGKNLVIGDSGRIRAAEDDTPQLAGLPITLGVVETINYADGGVDVIITGAEQDIILGGAAGDDIRAGAGSDIVHGDNALVSYVNDANAATLDLIDTLANLVGGADTIRGEADEDVLIGGVFADRIDGGSDRDLIFGDTVKLDRTVGDGFANARYRTLTGSEGGQLYSTASGTVSSVLVTGASRWIPGGAPVWEDFDILILDHDLATETSASPSTINLFTADYVAGGAGNDQIFGQLGDDVIQGDGSIDLVVGALRIGDGTLSVQASVEASTDGDDYIEGNAGHDVIFGNLGQDDIVGGSSSLFSLTTVARRSDTTGTDLIFGGAGTDIARNDLGDGRHARDADMILGDNGNIFRIVAANGIAAGFNYDDPAFNGKQGASGYEAGLKIVVRTAQLLDYTPGGPDFDPAAANDIGAADEIHGESGDDFIYGMKGGDAIFGEGQDDDIIGGYGNDWISGGTGDDGVIGDDGRIYTSRNGSVEMLNGVSVATVQASIKTGGNVQQADINVTGQLKKAVDITPFSQDTGWTPAGDEFGGITRGNSDDIIFGGWGDDFLHGGSGDDAISGAEALAESWAPTFSAPGVSDGRIRLDYAHPVNPGNVLAYNPVDENGKSSNLTRAGEFYLYDEYNPLRKILLDEYGAASTPDGLAPVGVEYFLNFEAAAALEGLGAPVATTLDLTKRTDGNDRIFGDLGNDWLVGGSGQDNLYGGFGNDLLNADDDLTTHGSLNDQPDTSLSYQDRAFGGAGRDVLIGNTGGDRLIDWSGEFNSYLVPFSPFGVSTVSRMIQPSLPDFLYALGASDGADFTRWADNPGSDPARNGEPFGELGLVLQKDDAWGDQHGGPADPQPGNVGGSKRDVLRTADFNNGLAAGFNQQAGTGKVAGSRYEIAPTVSGIWGSDAIGLFDQADTEIPVYFEMQATINAVKATAGTKANAFLIFDWVSDTDFKFAGVNISNNRLEIGHRNASGWVVDNWANVQVKAGNDYVILLKANGMTGTAIIGNASVSFTWAARIDARGVVEKLNAGIVGVGGNNARAQIDNVVVRKAPEPITVDIDVDFGSLSPADRLFNTVTQETGDWVTSNGRFIATAASADAAAINLASLGVHDITPGSLIDITTTLRTSGFGGVVFDYQGPNYYKFVMLSADGDQILIGHRTPQDGWVTDASFAFNVNGSTDYKLGVQLRGGVVNVSINGAILLSEIYAETVTMGGYGLISRMGVASGLTSFDVVRMMTDEGAYASATPLLQASTMAHDGATHEAPSETELATLLAQAKVRWAASGLDAASLAKLDTLSVQLADLPGAELGQLVADTLFVDLDAAGLGWFIDSTPGEDSEFRGEGVELMARPGGGAAGRIDLLSVLMHELGHAAGLLHTEAGVMAEDLAPGVRTAFAAGESVASSAPAALEPAWGAVAAPAVIDWELGRVAPTSVGFIRSAKTPDWVGDFVNHLAQTPAQRNPNAALRLHIDVQSRVASNVSALHPQ